MVASVPQLQSLQAWDPLSAGKRSRGMSMARFDLSCEGEEALQDCDKMSEGVVKLVVMVQGRWITCLD